MNLEVQTWTLSWKKIIKPLFLKGKILAIIHYHSSLWLFLSLRSMEIERQNESLTLTEKNTWKKERIEKTVKNKKAKRSQKKRRQGGERKPISKKLDESAFEWIQERRSKGIWVSQKFIMKKPRSCTTTWSKKASQVKIFLQELAGWERSCGAKSPESAYR